MNATFSNHQHAIRYQRQQIQCVIQAYLKGMQIAIIDADHIKTQRQRHIQLGPVMHLYQHIHADITGQPIQGFQLFRFIHKSGNNQQNAIGTDGARLIHLIFINNKILADNRQVTGIAGSCEIILMALEKVMIGQYRQAGGAS